MEEDIKNLIYTIEMHHISSEPIKKLIARYKELEKEYKVLREYVNFAPNLDEMSATKYKEICQSAYIEGRQDERNRAKEIIQENYIPKSKVKEKIEKLEKEIEEKQENCHDFTLIHEHEIDTNGIIQVLQELLED